MDPDSTLATYLRTVCPDADLSGVRSDALAFAAAMDVVGDVAPEIAGAIAAELADQRAHLKLIASENFASPATLLAMGNWLSDKYAEGSPGHRFYAGCDNVDTIESRAVELAKGLFGSDHAYVQPHSGIDANLVAFWAILTRRVEGPVLERTGARDLQSLADADWESLRRDLGNQRLLGMALDAGGHLTHGFRPNVSGKLFEIARYTVDPDTGAPLELEDGAAGGLVLRTHLEEIYHDAAQPPGAARIAISAQLVDPASRSVVARRTFVRAAAATSYDAPGAVQGFDQALGALLDDIVVWVGAQAPGKAGEAPASNASGR